MVLSHLTVIESRHKTNCEWTQAHSSVGYEPKTTNCAINDIAQRAFLKDRTAYIHGGFWGLVEVQDKPNTTLTRPHKKGHRRHTAKTASTRSRRSSILWVKQTTSDRQAWASGAGRPLLATYRRKTTVLWSSTTTNQPGCICMQSEELHSPFNRCAKGA